MRPRNRRTAGTLATAATALLGSVAEPAPAAQVRGSLSVTVQVLAACGGAVGIGGQPQVSAGCPPASAPVAILLEGPVPPVAPEPAAAIEGVGGIRYVTLIY
jgi:hypothetical protein